ncbi:MAG: isopentenyl-diphosphate Delta-isomerase [Bacteroidales bacterium]
MEEKVVLVDTNDNEIGLMGKQEAHEKAVLHRAVSVIILNSNSEMLIQQRALHKYHSPGKWANASCTHPRKGEKPVDAANRRLEEEMGIKAELKKIFDFVYKAKFDNGLTEHEFDHVLLGFVENETIPNINTDEVCNYQWIKLDKLKQELKSNPEKYTPWFRIIMEEMFSLINTNNLQLSTV